MANSPIGAGRASLACFVIKESSAVHVEVLHLTSRRKWNEIRLASPRNYFWAVWSADPRPRGADGDAVRRSNKVAPGGPEATRFAIEIGYRHFELSERGCGQRILGRPVEARSGQELHPTVLDAGCHAIAVELDLVCHCAPLGAFVASLQSCGSIHLSNGIRQLDRDERTK
jgi:hypothetical protein